MFEFLVGYCYCQKGSNVLSLGSENKGRKDEVQRMMFQAGTRRFPLAAVGIKSQPAWKRELCTSSGGFVSEDLCWNTNVDVLLVVNVDVICKHRCCY